MLGDSKLEHDLLDTTTTFSSFLGIFWLFHAKSHVFKQCSSVEECRCRNMQYSKVRWYETEPTIRKKNSTKNSEQCSFALAARAFDDGHCPLRQGNLAQQINLLEGAGLEALFEVLELKVLKKDRFQVQVIRRVRELILEVVHHYCSPCPTFAICCLPVEQICRHIQNLCDVPEGVKRGLHFQKCPVDGAIAASNGVNDAYISEEHA
mmetsp:Transcript_60078/g.119201  ORF Transcript_60078/g.119201 Transcript_60078/m.119201 type:complete len:207 (-) Transcript_60078:1597-2217(-)